MTHTDTTTITPVKLYTLKQGAKFIFPDDTTKTVFIAGKPDGACVNVRSENGVTGGSGPVYAWAPVLPL